MLTIKLIAAEFAPERWSQIAADLELPAGAKETLYLLLYWNTLTDKRKGRKMEIKIKCICGCIIQSWSEKQYITCLNCGRNYQKQPPKIYLLGDKREETPAELGVVIC
jgi:hypothetical protein